MNLRRSLGFLYPLLLAGFVVLGHAQNKDANPLAADPAAVREGESLFRANCSPCHGLGARGGGRGPNLTTGRWTHGSTDRAIFQTITQGVTGTAMPASAFEDSEVWTLVAYLRSVSRGAQAPLTGDAARGARIFAGKAGCSVCHMVQGRGGVLGPDLTRVGAARSIEYLIESIREPDKDISLGMLDPNNHYGNPLEYTTTTAVTRDGKKIRGIAKNEDAFSLQLLGDDQEFHFFLKKDLAEVRHERRSLMPAYTEKMLSNAELQDLLAYVAGLRGEQ